MSSLKALRIAAVVLMSVLQVCPKNGQSLSIATSSSYALQRLGPGSGGGDGGDYSADEKPSPQQVATAINEARRLVPFVLNHLENVITNARATGSSKLFVAGSTGDTAIPLDTYQKLFPWPEKKEDVQTRWQNLEFTIEPHKPCRNEFGESKAASAFPANTNAMCISIPMIQETAVVANLVQRITALLVHEVSHKMGVQDHLILETAIRSGLPANPGQALDEPLQRLLNSIDPTATDGIRILVKESLLQLERAPDWAPLCFNLASIQTAAREFTRPSVASGVPMALLRPQLEAEKQSIALRSSLLRGYCSDQQDVRVNELFKKTLSLPIQFSGSGVLSISRGTLRRPQFRNAALLRAELFDISSSLNKIIDAAKVSEMNYKQKN